MKTKTRGKIPAILISLVMALTMMPLMGQTAYAAGGITVSSGTPEIATWKDWHKGAATFTFEQSAPSHITVAAPMFNGYGYKASFYLAYDWVEDRNWNEFQAMADNGHEIGSCGTNPNPNPLTSDDVAGSKQKIESKIRQQYGCITYAYFNGIIKDETAVQKNYIAGRSFDFASVNGQSFPLTPLIMGKDGPDSWTRVPSLMTGPQGKVNTKGDYTKIMQQAIKSNGWVVFSTFGFQGANNGSAAYSPADKDAMNDALEWAHEKKEKDIWIAPLRNVAMYIKERNASTLALKEYNSKRVTYTLKHSIADDICPYDYPLSVRVPIPGEWGGVESVTQNGASLEYEEKDGMIFFDAVPNGDEIVLTRTAADPELLEIKSVSIKVSTPKCATKVETLSPAEGDLDTQSNAPEVTIPGGSHFGISDELTERGMSGAWISSCEGQELSFFEGTFTGGQPYQACTILKPGKGYRFAGKNLLVKINGKAASYETAGNKLIVHGELKAVHEFGAWKRLDDRQHQRVCARDSSHIEKANHRWNGGIITIQPAKDTRGVMTFTCIDCGATREEIIDAIRDDPTPKPDPKPTPKPDPARVSGTLMARMTASGKQSLELSWRQIKGAKGYDVFFIKCGKNQPRLVQTIDDNKTLTWSKAGLKARTPYKAFVKAYVIKNGKKTYVRTSPLLHAYTSGYTKNYTNPGSVTLKKTRVSLVSGGTYRIKASVTKLKKGKKLMPVHHGASLRYRSSNTKVATVSRTGKITAGAKGSCKVYVYAINGVYKAVSVTVR